MIPVSLCMHTKFAPVYKVVRGTFNMMTSSNGSIFRVTGHLCGEFTGELPAQRPVTRSFDVFFHLCLNKQLSKNNREAGDLRRNRTNYDVIVINILIQVWSIPPFKFTYFYEIVEFWLRFHWNLFPRVQLTIRCIWSSTNSRCSNNIRVTNDFIAYWGATYIRGLRVVHLIL